MIPTALAIVNELKNYQQAAKDTTVTTDNDSNLNSTDHELTDLTGKKHLYLAIDTIHGLLFVSSCAPDQHMSDRAINFAQWCRGYPECSGIWVSLSVLSKYE